jgi:DNA polymerase-3 subunit gamma/tau
MNLISQRPRNWNEVVGQERVVSLLQSLLTIGKFLPRGFILKGPWGVGKTSVAHLLSRALMCSGHNPLGCGKCPSCQFIDKEGIEHDPDFLMTDAASKPGVQDARDLMDCMIQPPITGRRRVAVIDEAHRLSKEAWDVFLKPLEEADTDSVFLFVTTDEDRIPKTIQSRCMPLSFFRVPEDTVMGFLASLSSQNKVDYDLPALKDIACHSKGIVRDAVRWLAMAASLGKVSRENVDKILDNPLESACLTVMLSICIGEQKAAAKLVDDAGRMAPPIKVIETMFSLYARSFWTPASPELSRIPACLPDIRQTTEVFLRWLSTALLPADALPLLVYELLSIAKVSKSAPRKAASASAALSPSQKTSGIGILEGEVI